MLFSPAVATLLYFSNMQTVVGVCLAAWRSDLCPGPVLPEQVSRCLSGTWSEWMCLEEANKRLGLWSHRHTPFRGCSSQTTRYLFTEMSRMADWVLHCLGQAGAVDLWRLKLAFVPVDTFTLSLGSRSSVVNGRQCRHGQIPLPHLSDEVETPLPSCIQM